MSAKLFLPSAVKYIPQKDFDVRYTENGGVEGHQTFLARKSSIGTSDLNLFKRGTLWGALYTDIPEIYKNLSMKTFDPRASDAPGIVMIDATFTGYQYAGNGSSGNEQSVPTFSLTPQLEEAPLNEHPKWAALSDEQKYNLGMLLSNSAAYQIATSTYGQLNEDGTGVFRPFSGDTFTATGDEIIFASMLAQGRTTYKRPVWNYTYRTESEKGFTSQQLNDTGKIVSSPEGNPPDLGSDWTWMLTGPSQEQSGEKRFFKTLDYLLIQKSDENEFLYG